MLSHCQIHFCVVVAEYAEQSTAQQVPSWRKRVLKSVTAKLAAPSSPRRFTCRPSMCFTPWDLAPRTRTLWRAVTARAWSCASGTKRAPSPFAVLARGCTGILTKRPPAWRSKRLGYGEFGGVRPKPPAAQCHARSICTTQHFDKMHLILLLVMAPPPNSPQASRRTKPLVHRQGCVLHLFGKGPAHLPPPGIGYVDHVCAASTMLRAVEQATG